MNRYAFFANTALLALATFAAACSPDADTSAPNDLACGGTAAHDQTDHGDAAGGDAAGGDAVGGNAGEGGSGGTEDASCAATCEANACGDVAGCECGTCPAEAVCAGAPTYCAQPVGHSDDFGYTRAVYGGIAFGYRVSLDADQQLRSFALLSGGAGPLVRMALYDATTGSQVALSGDVPLGAPMEMTEIPVPEHPLEAGDYWLVIHTSLSTPLRGSLNGDNEHEMLFLGEIPFDEELPSNVLEAPVLEDYRYNFYMLTTP